MKTLASLWADEAGFVVSSELVLIATIVVLGLITGLHSVRNSVVAELADVGGAVGNIDQSYSYAGATGHSSVTAGSENIDTPDFCETQGSAQGGINSLCVDLEIPRGVGE